MASNFDITDTDVSNLFKVKYDKISENARNNETVVLSRIKKSNDFVGTQLERPIPMGVAGGSGTGTLPKANRGKVEKAILLRKKIYSVCEVDGETVAASKDKGAFVESMKWNVQQTIGSNANLLERMLFGASNGELGTIDTSGVTDNGGGDFDVVISAATWKLFNWNIYDFINVGSTDDLFEVTAIDPANRTISLQRRSGNVVPNDGDKLYNQGGKDTEIEGLGGALTATAGSKYNIAIQHLWQATQIDASGKGISSDMLNEAMLGVHSLTKKSPNLILASYKQFRKILNFLEDQKSYEVLPRDRSLAGQLSFEAVHFHSVGGRVPIVPSQFIEDDRIYGINDNKVELCFAPGYGWFNKGGGVWKEKQDDDAYYARYGGYGNCYIELPYHFVIDGLA